jgi:hypothetical protein
LIFSSISISLLVSLVAGRRNSVLLGHRSRERTPGYLSTGISNLLQPAKAEVVLGQLSTYLASWVRPEPISTSQKTAVNIYWGCGTQKYRARILKHLLEAKKVDFLKRPVFSTSECVQQV